MRIVINCSYGGFGLSEAGIMLYEKLTGEKVCTNLGQDIDRTDPVLIEVIETLGGMADDDCSKLSIIEWPDDVPYIITEEDGLENIEKLYLYPWKER